MGLSVSRAAENGMMNPYLEQVRWASQPSRRGRHDEPLPGAGEVDLSVSRAAESAVDGMMNPYLEQVRWTSQSAEPPRAPGTA